MPSFNIDYLKTFCNPDEYKIFIETGTGYGGSLSQVQHHFEFCHTVELAEHIYKASSEKYKSDNTTFYLGDSTHVLPTIVPLVDKPAIIFLDGHWSCGETAQGDKDCPLYEELEAINKYLKPGLKTIIIIDDYRLFGQGSWADINKEECIKRVQDRLVNCIIRESTEAKEDRLIMFLE